ncbi:MMS19 nucleotide excision repair protein homolog isoform X2 [Brienomyrus brachyistius]|uniref:MMS19 nucleotide excision repair protein homolog isoform X2 n=1 Tax=Brienomyrus brachyistius TaxID=42636 RepID=UPI0020B229E6|nr:MMS19 nucleotide excision repair protein homolog isoform X2 [Brienomyrus brachyistius]
MATDGEVLLGLVEEFVSGQQDSKAAAAARGVKTGQFKILELVEALGLSLTSSQPQTRARGVQLLSEVLRECDSGLSEKEVEVLVAFYENRLKDHYVILPHVLQGIKALTKTPLWPPGLAVSVLRSLFRDIHVQSLMLVERSCVYSILINLMEYKEEELKGLGADFVFGFVQAMDSERDPRNLLLAFQIARNILLRGYELGKFTEELFEVTSGYFPLDFTPPPNNPHGITQEDLIVALRGVLSGTARFAEFLLPLIIEKLDSDVQKAKLDCLQTLEACVSVYSYRELKAFLSGLWASLRREVFQTASEKIEAAGLSALSALSACLSRSVLDSQGDDVLHVFLDLVVQDCQHHLCEPDLKLVWPSAKLLQAAASASYRASHRITSAVLPKLMEQYISETQCAHRRTLLEVLQGFVQPIQSSVPLEGDENVFSAFRESLCNVVFSALSESNSGLQVAACRVLASLCQQPGLLLASDVELAVSHLTRLVLEDGEPQVSMAVLECSRALSFLHTSTFAAIMVPRLKGEIFTEPMAQDDGPSPKALRERCMTALAAVSNQPGVIRESAPVLLEVLASSHTGTGSFAADDALAACRSLQRIVQQAPDVEDTGRFFHDIIIPRLLGLALQAGLWRGVSPPRESPLAEEPVLQALVPVMGMACARLQPQLSAVTAARVVSLFLDGDVSFLLEDGLPSGLQLLRVQHSWSLSQLTCLLMACVCSVPQSVELPQLERLMAELEELSCTSTYPFCYTAASKCFAGLVNKRPAGEALDLLLDRVMGRICSELDHASSSVRLQAFTLLLWVTKALLIRYHPRASVLTDKMFSLLTDRELGPLVADGFSVLMSDPVDVLTRAGHADVRIMYRQRFFTENSAKLVQGFNSAEKEMKPGYLKALSHIVNNLPRQVQLSELPALLPLLLEALSCPDQAVQLSTLSCLHPVLMESLPASTLCLQLEGLVSHLLGLTSSPTMKVRIASLRCLNAVSHFPEHEVIPFRDRVLRALAPPLDDKKRLVRKEAVATRGEWFLLGSPGR